MIAAIRATIVGGVVFLVPFVALAFVLGKALAIMRRVVAPLSRLLPFESVGGVLMVDVIAVVGIFALCLLAGLLARSSTGRALATRIEETMLATIPGYQFAKGMADSLASSQELAQSFTPVLARFDDYTQLAFEVDRTKAGAVVVYLPGAPNPWSGSVVYVDPERIERTELSMMEAVRNIRQLGRGSSELSPVLARHGES